MALKTVKRTDWEKLGKVRRTPQGGLRIDDSPVAKVGILEYVQADGTVLREYNPPEVLKDSAFLDSLRDAPVTNEHPPEALTPTNFRRYAAGYATGQPAFDGTYARASTAVQDGELIADVDGGKREEISLGYTAIVDYTPGTTPDGLAYDGIRTAITVNHIAIVSQGRAGPDVRLRLDSKGDSIIADTSGQPDRKPVMTPEQIAKLQADLTAATVRADSATAELTTAQKELKDAKEKLAALDKVRIDGLKAKAKALRPKLAAKIDAEGEAYAAAVIEAAEVEAPKTETPAETPAVETPKTDAIPTTDAANGKPMTAREKMLKRGRGEKV